MDKKVFSSSSAMKENMEKVKFSLKDQIGMNGHQQNNIVRYLPNIRINGVETNLRGNRVPSWDESSQEKNIPLNSSQILRAVVLSTFLAIYSPRCIFAHSLGVYAHQLRRER